MSPIHNRDRRQLMPSRFDDGIYAARDVVDCHDDLGDHNPIRQSAANGFLIDVQRDPRIVAKQFDLADAGNENVVHHFHVEQLNQRHDAFPLPQVREQPSTVRLRTQELYFARSHNCVAASYAPLTVARAAA